MGLRVQPTAQQLAFRDGFLAHGDPEKAYRDAGYTGSIKGMYRLLKSPWMDPREVAVATVERKKTEKAVRKAKATPPAPVLGHVTAPAALIREAALDLIKDERVNAAVDEILARPVHPLETRRGRALWLIEVMEGKVTVDREVSYFDQEGQRVTETEHVVPDVKDRIKAAELLSKMSGDHVLQINADVKAETKATAVVIHVDNGRGPLPKPAGTFAALDEPIVCGDCSAVFAKGQNHVCSKSP